MIHTDIIPQKKRRVKENPLFIYMRKRSQILYFQGFAEFCCHYFYKQSYALFKVVSHIYLASFLFAEKFGFFVQFIHFTQASHSLPNCKVNYFYNPSFWLLERAVFPPLNAVSFFVISAQYFDKKSVGFFSSFLPLFFSRSSCAPQNLPFAAKKQAISARLSFLLLLWIFFTACVGSGIIAYIIAAIVMPRKSDVI